MNLLQIRCVLNTNHANTIQLPAAFPRFYTKLNWSRPRNTGQRRVHTQHLNSKTLCQKQLRSVVSLPSQSRGPTKSVYLIQDLGTWQHSLNLRRRVCLAPRSLRSREWGGQGDLMPRMCSATCRGEMLGIKLSAKQATPSTLTQICGLLPWRTQSTRQLWPIHGQLLSPRQRRRGKLEGILWKLITVNTCIGIITTNIQSTSTIITVRVASLLKRLSALIDGTSVRLDLLLRCVRHMEFLSIVF